VSPYRTQSPDTSPRAERVLFELYRRMEPWQRVRIAFDLQQTVEDAARVGMRERRPGCSGREELLRLRALSYPRELMIRARRTTSTSSSIARLRSTSSTCSGRSRPTCSSLETSRWDVRVAGEVIRAPRAVGPVEELAGREPRRQPAGRSRRPRAGPGSQPES